MAFAVVLEIVPFREVASTIESWIYLREFSERSGALLPDEGVHRKGAMMFIYCCEICGEKFESTTTLEQAVQQYQQRFPGVPFNDKTQVACTDCFCLLMGAGAALHE
jgi:hypothetical protein